jgi:hypothetical protein
MEKARVLEVMKRSFVTFTKIEPSIIQIGDINDGGVN